MLNLRRTPKPLARAALWLAPLVLGAGPALGQPPTAEGVPPGWDLVYSQDFDDASSLRDFAFTDASAWDHTEGALQLRGGSEYRPPHRSPLNIALIESLLVGDFVLEVKAMQTGREYGHRDLCFFFGFEDPARFYYAHIATTPDPRAHNIFLVDRADRRPTAPVATDGVDWGSGVWQTIQIERREGQIRARWNGEEILRSSDTALGAGRLGFGSFDDQGRFDEVRIWAPESSTATTPAFRN